MLHQSTREALRLAERAKEAALRTDYRPGIAQGIYLVGQCRFILWGDEDSSRQVRQALTLFQSLGDRMGEANALNILSIMHSRRAEHERALQLSKQCLEIRRELSDRRGEAKSLINLGVTYRELQRLPEALETLLHARTLTEQLDCNTAAAYAEVNIGEVLLHLGDPTGALSHFERSLELNASSIDHALRSTILAGIGKTHLQCSNYEAAISCLLHSLEITQSTGNLDDRGITLYRLGQAYLALGFQTESREYLEEAHAIFKRNGNRVLETEVALALARGFLEQGRESDAIAILHQAIEQGDDRNEEIHRLLSRLYEKRGDLAGALHHFQKFYEGYEKTHSREAQQRIRELITRSEVQKVQRGMDAQRQANDELAQALEAAQQARTEKEELLRQLIMQTEILQQLAREDGLTGLANRRWLDLQLDRELERARRFGHPLSIALLDLDHFKSVNDTLSHQVGDEVLRTVARLLRDSCRSVDLLGRYGGEEFLLVLIETTEESGQAMCEFLRRRIESFDWRTVHPDLHGQTVSIGLAGDTTAHGTAAALLSRADARLYRAKAEGRNRVCRETSLAPAA